jgi:hypothetical protein
MEGNKMSNPIGWTMNEWKQIHDLKIKASDFNLRMGAKVFTGEISGRAKRKIIASYFEEKITR